MLFIFIFLTIRFYRLANRYKKRFINQNKLIKAERDRISSEIHDEIGSGLTGLKLYSEISARLRPEIGELKTIDTMIREISLKIKEIIWSSNANSDYLESLIYFIEEQVRKLFEHTPIKFRAELPEIIPHLELESQSRRDCYLIAKEIAHNVVKHAQATEVLLLIEIEKEQLILSIKDNGIGFDPANVKSSGMGINNIKTRTERLKAGLIIENYKGTRMRINIPMKHNLPY
ncbi:sensor histidine kinase [Pedobacter sandarakinus]|uniref:sensor histidine kinase n=1 Tax=Pedobacter sandarakinus TaxID=353156 RepID=UPI00224830F1|nr:ATP-binding protein [Pedobacter sandarakinus]MCX2574866.1 histidine kinase [Pedobacter sandarakinus]